MNTRIAFVACLLLAAFPIASNGEVWNLANDFSATENPNGAWSYGWRTAPEEPLNLYAEHTARCGAPQELEYWDHYIEDDCPRVTRNPQDYPVLCDNDVFEPHKVNFHPGPQQQSVVRWTAPANMEVALTVHFQAISIGSSVVHVCRNGTSLFVATLDGLGQTADYYTTITCQPGDMMDCEVDPISFYGDSVQLDVVLETTGPSPVGEGTWGQVKSLFR
jgi:hypothetical protein